MTKIKNWVKLITVLLISIGISFVLFFFSIVDIQTILSNGQDFHYNTISMSAVIGGFLFTGISILISAIDKERIKRIWENNYFDNLYRSAFVGMIANILTILSAFVLLCVDFSEKKLLQAHFIYVEIATLIIGIVFFLWCIRFLLRIIKKLKE